MIKTRVVTLPNGTDIAIVGVEHPNGGVSEVQVYLNDFGGDESGVTELQVSVSVSKMNEWCITRDDIDIDSSSEYA